MPKVSHVFLNLTTFETGTSIQCFTRLVGVLAGQCRRVRGNFTNTSGVHRFSSAKRVLALQAPGARFNLLHVQLGSLRLPAPLNCAEGAIANILWNPAAFCWDWLNDETTRFPIFNMQDDARGHKATKELWEAEWHAAVEQKFKGRRPSVCTLILPLATAVSPDAAAEGLRAVVEMLGSFPIPDDLRIYGNFGDEYADGVFNLVISSQDEPVEKLKAGFLRPKPLLGAALPQLQLTALSLGVHPDPLNLYTVSGHQLGIIQLSADRLDRIANGESAEFFVHPDVTDVAAAIRSPFIDTSPVLTHDS